MQKFTFPRTQTGFFTDQQNRLSVDQESILPFIQRVFSKESFEKQYALKGEHYPIANRKVLVEVLEEKYSGISCSEKTSGNLASLKRETTFTVTTGHQLNVFTGPVYSIYKMLHTIRLAEELNVLYPEIHVVPVFWMASEDHDFEEIRSVEVFQQRFNWDTNETGAVGRMSTNGLEELKKAIRNLFGNESTPELDEFFDAYKGENYGQAFFNLIHWLFDRYGMIIVDGDDARLKSCFTTVFANELRHQNAFLEVQKTNEQLIKEGCKLQVNPREINLFYLSEGRRDRIEMKDGKVSLSPDKRVSLEIALKEIQQHPERFSPNVILRPVYQETILPNLCYIGGVGEMAYWIQLKGVFERYNVPYPIITPRVSMLWIDAVTAKKMSKIDMPLDHVFREVAAIKKEYVQQHAPEILDFTRVDSLLDALQVSISAQAQKIDVNSEKLTAAEMVRLTKQIDNLKEKLFKAVKQQHEVHLLQIDQIIARLFPSGSLQERNMNLLSRCSTGQIHSWIQYIHSILDPFDMDFVVIRE